MKLLYCAMLIALTFFATLSWAMVPPQYLSVPKWKSCVGTKTEGTAQFVCLPDTRPKCCPKSSWKMLTEGHLIGYCKK